MMDCNLFQETITDYLDGTLETRVKAEMAAHRLRCHDCRELFNEVRLTVGTLGEMAREDVLGESTALENRILAATTAGEMLSCRDFDRLIENYFEGVILAPTFQTFQSHFKSCHKCRRLMGGIEEVISLCTEARQEVDLPASLHDRIMAATTGTEQPGWRIRARSFLLPLWTPQWAAAALIFAASFLYVHSRFGGFEGMANEAGSRAGQLVVEGNEAVTQTGAMAVAGVQGVSRRVNTILRDHQLQPVPVSQRPEPVRPGHDSISQPPPSPHKAVTRAEQEEAKKHP